MAWPRLVVSAWSGGGVLDGVVPPADRADRGDLAESLGACADLFPGGDSWNAAGAAIGSARGSCHQSRWRSGTLPVARDTVTDRRHRAVAVARQRDRGVD